MKTTIHATADNLTFEQLTSAAHTIVRPSGRKVYTDGYTRRMFASDKKTPATTTCRDCKGNGTYFEYSADDNMQCRSCKGNGFHFNN